MSESIKHECGIAMIRLRKPLDFYLKKYGTALYGLNKLYVLMEKQNNRGQDGAGVATIKLDMPPGERYISRHRSTAKNAVTDIFEHINERFVDLQLTDPEKLKDTEYLKNNLPYTGELLLGHLRYGTHGVNTIESCHPFLRQNNWMTRNLVVAGNFNMTNVDELVQQLIDLGQHPKEKADTITVLEKIGHFLDDENEILFRRFKSEGYDNIEITRLIAEQLDVAKIIKRSAKLWDGGYTICGLMGHGDAFVIRDPAGIRPAFYYANDEVVVVASERPAIQTAFNVPMADIKEVKPAHALVIKKNGDYAEHPYKEATEKLSCSFERIYFSRGNDTDIYQERKKLGKLMIDNILETVNGDVENTVFSFIPNTADVAFMGMAEGLHQYINEKKKTLLAEGDIEGLKKMIDVLPRIEKITIKDAKLRTFITNDGDRNDLVNHVYDTTYGVVKATDNLVVIDDSIVRGTTLKNSILKKLDRLHPKKIVIASSAPQIRYPDCYGIDMSRMGEFVAFVAAINLLKKSGQAAIIDEVYALCKTALENNTAKEENFVKRIYAPFTDAEISAEIVNIVKPEEVKAEVAIIYQTIENLHIACPDHKGDWYFSGNYPTPGGNKVVNRAFVNYVEGNKNRAY